MDLNYALEATLAVVFMIMVILVVGAAILLGNQNRRPPL